MPPRKKQAVAAPRASSSEDVPIAQSNPSDDELGDDVDEIGIEPSGTESDEDEERAVDPNYKKQAKEVKEIDIMDVYRKLPLLPLAPADAKLELRIEKQPYDKLGLNPQTRQTDGWGNRQDVGKRKERQKIIASILQRWWFVFPMWPAKDFDFESELRKRNYRLVEVAEWEKEPDVDGEGYQKVWGAKMYLGLFRDVQGKLLDMRPKQTCPCYANLNRRPLEELIDYLERAYENQIRVMKEYPTYESDRRIKMTSDELATLRKKRAELVRTSQNQRAQTAFQQALGTMRKL